MYVSYRKYVKNSDLLSTWEDKINLQKNKSHSSLCFKREIFSCSIPINPKPEKY